jgi:hypothetical protein
MRFTDIPSRVLAFTVSDDGMWVAAPIAALLTGIMLILIALWTRRDTGDAKVTQVQPLLRHVRRHTPRGGLWPTDATVLLPRFPKSHWALTNDQWHDRDHPLDAPSTGRRSIHNPARTVVPSDWRPPIGDDRIRLIDTVTVEVTEFRRLLREGAV